MAFSRSVVSSSLGRDWVDGWDFPSRFRDPYFGYGLGDMDLVSPSYYRRGFHLQPRRQLSSGGLSDVRQSDENGFRVLVDVSQFTPEEITVKTVDNHVIVNAKHEEKVDDHGFVSREFTRRYLLPTGIETDAVTSTLGADGVLAVEALSKKQLREKAVPISISSSPCIPPKEHEIPVVKESKTSQAEQPKPKS